MNKFEKLTMRTSNLADNNFTALAAMFPNAVTETIDENGSVVRAIDADILAQEMNTRVVSGKEERYQFTWPDKKKSVLLANAPTDATLRPCREESVDFDNTENLYIEGDNLDILKLLRETYLNRVKMIYIDPPYNTGNDFVYEDDFAEETGDFLKRDRQFDEQGNRLTPNLESNGRFHTDWLNMIYPRLRAARDLLAEDGVIFISIDDNEVAQLRKICDEVFGESNFVVELIWKSKSGGANDSKYFAIDHEYILCYAKDISEISILMDTEATVTTSYNQCDDKGKYSLDRLDKQSIRYSSALDYEIIGPRGESYKPKHKNPAHPNATWRWGKETVQSRYDELVFKEGNVYTKNYKKEGAIARSLLLEDRFGRTRTGKTDNYALFERDLFSNPKPFKLIQYLNIITTQNDDIILDFFSGSATTAHAVMKLNTEDGGKRKFIMVQLPEPCDEKSEAYKAGYKNICEIGKERIRRAGAKVKDEAGLTVKDLDIGFRVLKLDSSNMKKVDFTPEEYAEMGFDMDGFIDNIKPDRTDEDLLFQVMLELGIPMSAKIMQDGKLFYVNDNYLIACFGKVDTNMITQIAKKKPYYAVFRDSSFQSDSALVNFEQVFNTYSPSTIRRVL